MNNLINHLPEKITGKKILISGGTSNDGQSTALMLAALGAKILIIGQNQDILNETMQKLRTLNRESNCYGMVGNPANPEDLKTIFTVIDRHFRGLDILINNDMLSYQNLGIDDPKTWEDALRVNLNGQINCTREAIKRMRKKEYGQIININSITSDLRKKYNTLYEAAQSGIRKFNERILKEVKGSGIEFCGINAQQFH
ncbi:SDR family NAD(P)-dependent oxidoreductase [Pedobacter metabolipauper]|uniref:NAD(P)-dependent dehydrogenase (Short-subunit alcohol dehydrogenase family) n=1 Tax=Pedobacter metabolipauper TaxID=425513 RepID=A0A4R6SVV2_9SPHI|nr:SDR family oxidoreductase [Pedobacter metabolipauper]TDQ10028.1 NAD(P)-dependent dehydrogenase (short-subunit alcohol dehydrogenase family) [Pedobacter metabolipauper]